MRPYGVHFFACGLLLSCGAPDVSLRQVHEAARAPAKVSTPPPLEMALKSPMPEERLAPLVTSERAECKSAGASISIPAAGSALACKDGWHACIAEIPVTIENCTGADLKIEDARLQQTSLVGEIHASLDLGSLMRWSTLEAGERVTRLAVVKTAGTYLPRLRASSPDGRGFFTTGPEGAVENPAYEAARQACKACNGEWGVHGMLATEGCVCRSPDGGRPCHDGNECAAGCVFVRVEKLPGGLGRRVGRCAEFVGGFGCVSLIDPGESKLPPRPFSELVNPSTRICAD